MFLSSTVVAARLLRDNIVCGGEVLRRFHTMSMRWSGSGSERVVGDRWLGLESGRGTRETHFCDVV